MEGYRYNSFDSFWIIFVLIHVIGSAFLTLLLNLPVGILVLNSIIWLCAAYMNHHRRAGIFLSGLGWSITLFLFTHMPSGYSASLALNLIVLIFILYLHYGDMKLVIEENHIKPVGLVDLGYIIILTGLFLIIAEYVNAVSMIFFHNYVTDSLGTIRINLVYGILVFALVPALAEELLFRGYIFQRLGNGWKAILISALLFSLGHMNFNQMSYAFVVGFLFAIVFSVTGNLAYTLCIHCMFNLYSLFMMAYGESWLAELISGINVGGYHLFYPSLLDSSGNLEKMAVLSGFFIFLMAVLLVLLVLHFLRRRYPAVNREGAEAGWTPGIAFWLATVICLVITVLREFV